MRSIRRDADGVPSGPKQGQPIAHPIDLRNPRRHPLRGQMPATLSWSYFPLAPLLQLSPAPPTHLIPWCSALLSVWVGAGQFCRRVRLLGC